MNNELWDQAIKLAARQYNISSEEDTLSTGETVYLLKHPELPGCKAQGRSIDEAKTNLDDARVDYIYALLETGLPVPGPASFRSDTESIAETKMYVFDASLEEDDFPAMHGTVITPDSRETGSSISLQGDLVEHR